MNPEFLPHQHFAFDWLQSRPRAILALEQRLGKTPVAIRDIRQRCNIVCPAFLTLQWEAEVRRWRPDLEPRIIRSCEKPARGGNVFIMSYDILQSCWLAGLPELIVDEGHYCVSHEAKRTITTLALAGEAERVRWLTGTVMPNRSMDLWPVATAMGATKMSAIDWGQRYAGGYQDQWGKWVFRDNTRSPELAARIEPYILRITREQAGYLPNEWRVVALDLPVDKRERAYDLGAIERNPRSVAFEGLAELLSFQGMAKLPQALDYLKALLRQDEGPLLVFAWHVEVIAELARALTAGGYRVGVITGDVGMADRHALVQRFQRGELDVVIGNTKAAGEGLPMHAAERVVFVEGRWSPAAMNQPADRGVSMERPRSLRVDVLCIHGSIDEHMVRRCLEKQDAIDRVIKPNEEFSRWQDQQKAAARPRPELHPRTWLRSPFVRAPTA